MSGTLGEHDAVLGFQAGPPVRGSARKRLIPFFDSAEAAISMDFIRIRANDSRTEDKRPVFAT
jgi:hypothetical protein